MSVQEGISVFERVPDLRGGVVRRSMRDIVAAKLASLIASGLLQVGDALPSERDLAATLQVSRETVRGALQVLMARGVIEVSHGARTRVISADVGEATLGLGAAKSIDRYDIEAVHAARLLVERQVVAEAARLIDDATLEMLEASLKSQLAATDNAVSFLISDREFHVAIYKACGNALLADFVTDLYTYMMEHRRKAVSRPGAIQESCSDHVAILEGLRSHDPAAVVAAFDVHLDRIYATTRSVLGGAGRRRAGSARGRRR